jgi:hypothetical protein
VVQELINAGASIADPPRVANALAVACQGRRHSIIEFLLEELSGTDKEEFTCSDALSAASSSHDDEILLFLLEHRVSVGNRGDGNLRLIGLIGLGPASRVFTCSLLDRLISSFNLHTKMPHMTSTSNSICVSLATIPSLCSRFPRQRLHAA